jgi:hypothetical protein
MGPTGCYFSVLWSSFIRSSHKCNKQHSEELHNLYASPNIIRVSIKYGEIGGTCSTHGRRRWEDIIRISLREIGWEVSDWIHLAQNRGQWRVVVNMAMNLRVP